MRQGFALKAIEACCHVIVLLIVLLSDSSRHSRDTVVRVTG